MSDTPQQIEEMYLYAWVGEDELESGEFGLKQAITRAGMVPLVATSLDKVSREYIWEQLQQQVNTYGKPIHLCRFKFENLGITLIPKEEP